MEIGGRRYALRLSLQALAEIETALAVKGLAALGERLGAGGIGAADLVHLLGALIRGGGAPIADHELARMIDAQALPEIVAAIGDVFALSFGAAPAGHGGEANNAGLAKTDPR